MGEHEEHIAFEMGYNKGFKDGIKGSIPKDQYENRLKADMVAILEELQLEIEEVKTQSGFDEAWDGAVKQCSEIIKQKINLLKGDKE